MSEPSWFTSKDIFLVVVSCASHHALGRIAQLLWFWRKTLRFWKVVNVMVLVGVQRYMNRLDCGVVFLYKYAKLTQASIH